MKKLARARKSVEGLLDTAEEDDLSSTEHALLAAYGCLHVAAFRAELNEQPSDIYRAILTIMSHHPYLDGIEFCELCGMFAEHKVVLDEVREAHICDSCRIEIEEEIKNNNANPD